jgi:intein/homing endonuclease
MAGKLGTPYFANFINSDMDPSDCRSMCPLAGTEKILLKSTRGRGLEYSNIQSLLANNGKEEYEVFSDGRFIKGRFNKFPNQKMLKVSLVNGHSVTMSENHLNYIMKNEESRVSVVSGYELQPGDYLPYSTKTYPGEGGSYDLGYFIGAFAGDGSMDGDASVVFSLGRAKEEAGILDKLRSFAVDNFGARISVKRHDDKELVTLRVNSRALVGVCNEFVRGKERGKHYTANVFAMSETFRRGVIAGHYATDGGNRNRIYTASWKMVETLNMLAATLGTTTNVAEDNRDNRLSDDTVYTVRFYELANDRYGDSWFKAHNKLWMRIADIESLPAQIGYCFEAASNEEPIFTIGSTGILTHNCRLRLDKRELLKRGGGLFGSGEKTGSIGVVTLNLPRIAYLAEGESHFYQRLDKAMELAKDSLEIKRPFLQEQLDRGLLPAFSEYVGHLNNHFSTIGLVGMNEMCHNLLGVGIADPKGKQFSVDVLGFMRDRLVEYQEETGNLFNLEATPAESCAHRLAKLDVAEFGYGNISVQGPGNAPYYTNSCHLPVHEVETIFSMLQHQDELQVMFTGGTVCHLYLTGD